MKNITKKILILTGLLIFSCNTNFCMQNDEEVIKSPNGKWKVIKRLSGKKILSWIRKTEIAQVVNVESNQILREYELADQTDRFGEKRVLFSPNGRYVGFKTLIPKYRDYFGELIILDLENNFEEIVPFDKKENQFTLQYFTFGPNSRYIAAIMYVYDSASIEHDSDMFKIFDLKSKKDITEEIRDKKGKIYKRYSTCNFTFSPNGKFVLLTNKYSTDVYNIETKKKIAFLHGSNKINTIEEWKIMSKISEKYIASYGFNITEAKRNKKKITILNLKTSEEYTFEFDEDVLNFFFISDNLLKVECGNKKPKTIYCIDCHEKNFVEDEIRKEIVESNKLQDAVIVCQW